MTESTNTNLDPNQDQSTDPTMSKADEFIQTISKDLKIQWLEMRCRVLNFLASEVETDESFDLEEIAGALLIACMNEEGDELERRVKEWILN